MQAFSHQLSALSGLSDNGSLPMADGYFSTSEYEPVLSCFEKICR